MVLSDRTIRRLIAEGRIGIEPYEPSLMQPSSVDVRVDRLFRVFRNNRYPFIDVKVAQEELTELVVVEDDDPFILHPGEFVLGSTLERVTLPDDLVARLEGKALALDVEIPTTEGWRTMGDVRVGDIVFDMAGHPTVVVGATEPMTGRPCREVVFSDGPSIVCDAHHQWVTVDENERRSGHRLRVRATDEIARTLVVRDELNHYVPLAGPARYPARELPIDPYVLGAWLGDGTRTKAETRCNDHLRASAEQRQALLEVQFSPDRPVFRLPQKLERQRKEGGFHGFRAITEVRPHESVPVRCIQVSSPSGTFLATRAYVPTHNSSLGRLGLLIHSTAGFIDPGFDGHVTLELSNVANLPITIYPGMKIGQLSFVRMTEPAEHPYGSRSLGSKYQGQKGPTPSRYWKNFTE